MGEQYRGDILDKEIGKSDATEESVIAAADKYLEILNSCKDGEQVAVSMGTLGTTVELDAAKLKDTVTDVKARVESGEVSPSDALKDLWGGNLIILTPEKSKEFSKRMGNRVESELEKLDDLFGKDKSN
jgi:hypothetical protein